MTATQCEVTQQQSLAAVRNFLRVAVSSVAYLRGLCDDASFRPHKFLGLELRQLVPSTPEAEAVSRWLEEGAFDALARGYLRELSLCLYTPDCARLLESFVFTINYGPDGTTASASLHVDATGRGGAAAAAAPLGSRSQASAPPPCGSGHAPPPRRVSRDEVQRMLTDVVVAVMRAVEHLPPLESERVLAMRLAYHDAATPAGYEPPGFAAAGPVMVRLYRDECRAAEGVHSVAALDTTHHAVAVSIRRPAGAAHTCSGGRTSAAAAAADPTATDLADGAAAQEGSADAPAAEDGRCDAGSASLSDLLARTSGTLPLGTLRFLVVACFFLARAGTGPIAPSTLQAFLKCEMPPTMAGVTPREAATMVARLVQEGLLVGPAGSKEVPATPHTFGLLSAALRHTQLASVLPQCIVADAQALLAARPAGVAKVSIGKRGSKRERADGIVASD